MRYKVTILDSIAAVIIFGWALMRYANLYYEKGLDQVGSLLCFVFHILAMTLIYLILHFLYDKLLKPEVQFIMDYILQEDPEYQTPLAICSMNKSTEPQDYAFATEEHTEVAENANEETETITESVSTQQPIVEDIEPYQPYKRRNLHVETVDTLYDLMYHFIGQHLDEDGKAIVRENLLQFSMEKRPEIKPIPLETNLTCHKYDLLHLCHGVGNHTRKTRSAVEIAEFAIICFPDLFPGDEPKKMVKKLTCIDYRPMLIPVFDKKEPLPRFD